MIRINLIKEEGKERAFIKLCLALYSISMGISFLLMIYVVSVYSSRASELEAQFNSLTTQKARLARETTDVAQLDQEKSELVNKLKVIAHLKRSKTGPVQVLDQINIALPDKSWLYKVSEASNSSMEIAGYALENDLISMFAEDLGRSKFFPKVTIVEVVQDDYQDIKVAKFLISADVSFDGSGKTANEIKSNQQANEVGRNNG